MTGNRFEALNEARKVEAAARKAKRKAVSEMNAECGAAACKHFPELKQSKTVDGESVPMVEDVDEFFKEVARVYHEYQRVQEDPAAKFWHNVETGKIWR